MFFIVKEGRLDTARAAEEQVPKGREGGRFLSLGGYDGFRDEFRGFGRTALVHDLFQDGELDVAADDLQVIEEVRPAVVMEERETGERRR